MCFEPTQNFLHGIMGVFVLSKPALGCFGKEPHHSWALLNPLQFCVIIGFRFYKPCPPEGNSSFCSRRD